MDFKPQTIYIVAALVAAAGLIHAVVAYRAMVGKTTGELKVTKNVSIGLMVVMAIALCFFLWTIFKGRGVFKGLKLA
jgi:succinate dehydrogenase hydrophobic anchor subunit